MANATILTVKDSIKSPIPGNPKLRISGLVLVSDSFKRSGSLVGSQTDNYAGGSPKVWTGTTATMSTVTPFTYNQQITFDGVAQSLGTLLSNSIDAGVSDCSVSFRIAMPPSNNTMGYNSLIDFRKERADGGSCYRIGIYSPSGIEAGSFAFRLIKRIGTAGSYITTTDTIAKVGDVITVDLMGSNIKVYVNGELKINVDDTSITTGTFYGFGSSTGTQNGYYVANYVIRTV